MLARLRSWSFRAQYDIHPQRKQTDMRNKIKSYLHCMPCIREKPADIAMSDWARLNVGQTKNGLQVWCVRHNCNVGALDFRGANVVFEDGEPWATRHSCQGCGTSP
jgi:hypothetical protein